MNIKEADINKRVSFDFVFSTEKNENERKNAETRQIPRNAPRIYHTPILFKFNPTYLQSL